MQTREAVFLPMNKTILMACGARYEWMKQRPTHLADCFSLDGHDVFFLTTDGGEVGISRTGVNVILQSNVPKKVDVLWVSFGGAAGLLNGVEYETLVFDNLDSDFNGHWAPGEASIVPLADVIFCTADGLYQKRKKAYPDKVYRSCNGVDTLLFATKNSPPCEMRDLPRPIFGYMGALAPWVDGELLERFACFVEGSVVLVGAEFGLNAHRMPTCHHLGYKPYDELPAYIQSFDVGLIPFGISSITIAADPLKLYQYMAAGINVLSTPLPEVKSSGIGEPDLVVAQAQHWTEPGVLERVLQPGTGDRDVLLKERDWRAIYGNIKGVLCERGIL